MRTTDHKEKDRKEKLRVLKALVRTGEYVVDEWAIAASMLRRELLVGLPQPLTHGANKHAVDAERHVIVRS